MANTLNPEPCSALQGRPGYGENLYISYNSPGTAPPVTTGWVNGMAAWYNEIALYNYGYPGEDAAIWL